MDKKPELSVNIVAFISCRGRLSIILTVLLEGSREKGSVDGGKQSVIDGC